MLSLLTSTPLFAFCVPKVDELKSGASIGMQNVKDSTRFFSNLYSTYKNLRAPEISFRYENIKMFTYINDVN